MLSSGTASLHCILCSIVDYSSLVYTVDSPGTLALSLSLTVQKVPLNVL